MTDDSVHCTAIKPDGTRHKQRHAYGTRIVGLDCNQLDPACLNDSALL